ncbi:MAG: LLM class flavin-dependent oxidoreductase [Alphaproteobacteria bacterium]|nr:LLM class flavin-dependent oxidoreductase [Alphaproteobacteria bacterium]
MSLSVLDQSTALSGRPPEESIRETIELARLCDGLGYRRFWVSEHHNHPSIVGTAPEILVAAIAATTRRIRVGSAGVMLPHYATLKVAEQFRVLEAIAPGRIDLGVGRAPGGDFRTSLALNPRAETAADQFPAQLRDLMAWVAGTPLPDGHPFQGIQAHPAGATAPEFWVLGSSDYGAQVAAHFGLPYCFAYFFSDGRGVEQALGLYRQYYRPSPGYPAPHPAICVWALAAASEEEAQRQFTARAVWRILRDRNMLLPLPTPQEAAGVSLTPPEQAKLERMRETAMVGSPDKVRRMIDQLAASLQVPEVAVVTWAHDATVRRDSYRLLAREYGLDGQRHGAGDTDAHAQRA